MTDPDAKLQSLGDLEVVCAKWREQGLVVVLVNGAFDVRRSSGCSSQLGRIGSREQGREAADHPGGRTGGNPFSPLDGGSDLPFR